MPTTYRYDHIHLRSANPRQTAEFYHKMFGAKIIETPQPTGPARVDLDVNGLAVFIAGPGPDGVLPPGLSEPHGGLDHFGFLVADLDTAVAELKAKGAEFSTEPRALPTGIKIAFVRGPDGVRIELVQRR
ncbi:MAG: VOC family protein [SAR202 cluster bacterium]|nr:VOC family protein [SAR202 cluster bacterium]